MKIRQSSPCLVRPFFLMVKPYEREVGMGSKEKVVLSDDPNSKVKTDDVTVDDFA